MLCVFGSINVDHVLRVRSIVRPGETVLAREIVYRQGGKGANQAVAAARAGASVAMIGAVGRDANGDSAKENLIANAIDVDGLATVADPSGCAFISLDDAGENAIVVVSGANGAARLLRLPDACSTLVCQMEVPVDAVAEALALAAGKGCRTVLNLAPVPVDLTVDQARRLIGATDVLIVNEGECRDLGVLLGIADADMTIGALADRLGCALVVTQGARGVRFRATGRIEAHIAAHPVEAVDTTGAGDTFVGVLAACLDSGDDLEPAIRRASVAGALACRKVGAQEGMPFARDIDAALVSPVLKAGT